MLKLKESAIKYEYGSFSNFCRANGFHRQAFQNLKKRIESGNSITFVQDSASQIMFNKIRSMGFIEKNGSSKEPFEERFKALALLRNFSPNFKNKVENLDNSILNIAEAIARESFVECVGLNFSQEKIYEETSKKLMEYFNMVGNSTRQSVII